MTSYYVQTITPQPTLVRDLVFCDVSIWQAPSGSNGQPAYGSAAATLSISSFGTCRGLWTFMLMVSDSCQQAMDSFNLNVGCNRPPAVSAGCTNTQTWAGSSFSQVNLDGRASYDPDNFGDSFYNLTLPNGMAGSALTYAWSLVSAPSYVSTTAANANTTCPFNPWARCA